MLWWSPSLAHAREGVDDDTVSIDLVVEGDDVPSTARSELDAEVLEAVPGAFGDPVHALQALPGVARASPVDGTLAVRGAEGMATAFQIDGLPIPYMFHVLLGKSVVHPTHLQGITFVKGGLSASVGGATQALVDVHTVQGPVDRPEWSIDVNLLDAAATVRTSRGRTWMASSVRGAWAGGLVALGSIGSESALVPVYGDATVTAGLRLDPRDELTALVVASDDVLTMPVDDTTVAAWNAPGHANTMVGNRFVRGRVAWVREAGSFRSTTWVGGGPSTVHVRLGALGDWYRYDGPLDTHVVTTTLLARHEDRWRLGAHRIGVGLDASATLWRAWNLDEALGPVAPAVQTADAQSAAPFVEGRVALGALTVEPGARVEAYLLSGVTTWVPQPRLGLRLALGPDLALEASGGRTSRLPPLDRATETLSGPMDTPLSTWGASAGPVFRRGPLQIGSTVYVSRTTDLLVRTTDTAIVRSGPVWVDEEQTAWTAVEGDAVGLESSIGVDAGRPLWGWLSLTVGRSVRTDGTDTWRADSDEPVAFGSVLVWDASRHLHLSARGQVGSGHPYTPLEGLYAPQTGSWVSTAGPTNSDRFPWFRQLDLRGEWTWTARCGTRSVSLDLYNATFARNPLVMDYDSSYSRTTGSVWLPMLPIVGFEARHRC